MSTKPVIVELGYSDPEFLYKRARRFPQFHHVGIDRLKREKSPDAPSNAELRQDHFDSGLEGFKENSLEGVNARLSVGFYNKPPHDSTEEHTERVANLTFSRLGPGKKFRLVVDNEMTEKMREHLKKAGFEGIRVSKIKKNTPKESRWMKRRNAGNIPMARINARKPHRR